MSDKTIDVLAVMFADQFDAIPKRQAFADGKHLAALNAKSEAARAAIAELIEADREFDAAHHDWEHVTAHDPQETSDEDWRRIADRFEAATMRRIAALARVGATK